MMIMIMIIIIIIIIATCDSVKSLFSTPLSLWATLVTPNTYIGGDSTGAQTSVRRTSQVPESELCDFGHNHVTR